MVTVTQATVNVNTFKTIYNLLNTYKPSGWTVLSSYPKANPVFPCIVVNPAKVHVESTFMRSEGRKYLAEVELDFYAKASSRKEAIDTALDSVRQTLFTYESSLETDKLVLDDETPFDQTNVDTIRVNNDKLHYASAMVKLRVLV